MWLERHQTRRNQRGISYIELMVALAVLMILAGAVVPMARWDHKRRNEERLRVSLQNMRDAIDKYNEYMGAGLIQINDVEQCALPNDLATCYPLTLDELVEGVEVGDPQSPETRMIKFLQRMPIDPMTEDSNWGLRSYQDDFDSDTWGGQNVYDVYSESEGIALNGTYYREW